MKRVAAAGAGAPSLSSAGRQALGGSPRPTAVSLETNPFILPSDEDVFKMREKEVAQREQARFVVGMIMLLLLIGDAFSSMRTVAVRPWRQAFFTAVIGELKAGKLPSVPAPLLRHTAGEAVELEKDLGKDRLFVDALADAQAHR